MSENSKNPVSQVARQTREKEEKDGRKNASKKASAGEGNRKGKGADPAAVIRKERYGNRCNELQMREKRGEAITVLQMEGREKETERTYKWKNMQKGGVRISERPS